MKDEKKVRAGQKGGITKWARIPKTERPKIMSEVAKARYKNPPASN